MPPPALRAACAHATLASPRSATRMGEATVYRTRRDQDVKVLAPDRVVHLKTVRTCTPTSIAMSFDPTPAAISSRASLRLATRTSVFAGGNGRLRRSASKVLRLSLRRPRRSSKNLARPFTTSCSGSTLKMLPRSVGPTGQSRGRAHELSSCLLPMREQVVAASVPHGPCTRSKRRLRYATSEGGFWQRWHGEGLTGSRPTSLGIPIGPCRRADEADRP
jgi:hypothetical protein